MGMEVAGNAHGLSARYGNGTRRAAFITGGFLGFLVCALAVLLQPAPTPALAQGTEPCNVYDNAGTHVFEVPAGVTEIEATVFGAQGGDVLGASAELGDPGLGGGATDVTIAVTPGELLEIVVGGAGTDSVGATAPDPVGGFNGGGDGAVGSAHTSATGGGASEINRGATTLIIVGGGGGGAHGGDGGDGGLVGTDGTKHAGSTPGSTGGQAGGAGGAGGEGGDAGPGTADDQDGGDGAPGEGGDGGGHPTTLPVDGGGGGGGGFVGGGGGGGGAGNGGAGGGGGSSFDSTGTATFQTGVQTGDGLITLTYDCSAVPEPPEACVTFDDDGTYNYEIPAGVTEVQATVFGAQGGTFPNATQSQVGTGGRGGGASGLPIAVTPGETLDIVVGGVGGNAPAVAGPGGSGGSPGGGGNGGSALSTSPGAGGGGFSQILRGSDSLVIGGAGGGGARTTDGGRGGFIGTNGEAGNAASAGVAGGSGGFGGGTGVLAGGNGSQGQGGNGGPNTVALGAGGGGGGGGAVGGGGGSGRNGSAIGGGGGGGSSAHSLGLVPVTWQQGVEEGDGRVELAFDCADVSITKDAALVDEDTIEYTVTVENLGPNAATGVVATDPLPEEVTYDSDDCGGAVDASGWSWNIGDLAAGADVTCVITVTADEFGTIDNTSSVDMDQIDLDPDNNSDPASVFVPSADLELEKTSSPAIVDPNGQVTWTLTVTNHGPDASTGSTVTDTLPAAVTNVASPTAGCTVQGNAVSCDVGALAVDGSTDITITGTAPSTLSTCFDNAGEVTGDDADPDPDNNTASVRTCTPPVADLELAKTAEAVVDPSGQVTWTLTVTNHGPNDSSGSTVTDTLPAGVTNVQAQTAGCTVQDNAVSCALGALDVDGSTDIVLTGNAPSTPSTCFSNAGSVEGDEDDPVLANNEASVETCTSPAPPEPPPGKPKLSVNKRASTDAAHPGGVISYRITVRNKGKADAKHVKVCDRLPGGQQLLQAPDASERSSTRVCWKLKRLKAGAKKTFKVVTQVKFGSKLGTQRNKALAKAGNAKRKSDVVAVRIRSGAGPCPAVGSGLTRC
jgi:uncharacterized repeat protein (TIGR01451 family)